MKIIQITDLHIPDISDSTHDIDIIGNLVKVCNELQKIQFDLLVITGDIAYKTPNHESYSFLQKIITVIDKPTIVLPGNHDDAFMLKEYFPIRKSNKNTYFTYTFKKQKFICLDSSKSIIDDKQLLWFEKELENQENAIVFMHHPILQTDVKFMESKHALKNRKEIVSICKKINNSVTFFCGHFHIDRHTCLDNINQYISPSLFYQIRPDVLHFEIGSFNIGYRAIQIQKAKIETQVYWIDKHDE